MTYVKKYIRKLLVLAIGLPLIVVGIILIPLPGPGVLITLLGVFILSLEFEVAKKHLDVLHHKINKVYQASLQKYHERNEEIDKKF